MFCKHDWSILSEKTTESQVEHLDKLGQSIKSGATTYMIERKFIQIVACKKCGKLKRYVESI